MLSDLNEIIVALLFITIFVHLEQSLIGQKQFFYFQKNSKALCIEFWRDVHLQRR